MDWPALGCEGNGEGESRRSFEVEANDRAATLVVGLLEQRNIMICLSCYSFTFKGSEGVVRLTGRPNVQRSRTSGIANVTLRERLMVKTC